ncbi:MAG: hypothetical protein HGB10_03770 [Coriobacteriia bacterium]|nr:hypothetical protein [Coriobacteriia bacterium]
MTGWRRWFAEEHLIWWLLGVAALIRIAALLTKGVTYDSNFDDAIGYMDSARVLVQSGRFSFYDVAVSARVMPGLVLYMAAFHAFLRDNYTVLLAAKLSFVAMWTASIYLTYLIGRRIGGVWVGLASAAMLTVSLPSIYTGTVVLTENPFTACVLLAIYATIRVADEPGWRWFFIALGAILVGMYVKQGALGMLLPVLVYLLVKRYPPHLLVKQMIVAVLLIVVALAPWALRNYLALGHFVPFTSYESAALFHGAYQRFQPYGNGEAEALEQLLDGRGYTELETNDVVEAAAKHRLAEQWAADPLGEVRRYLIMKPAAAWLIPFYWDSIFGINGYWVLRIQAISAALGLGLLVLFSVRSRARAEFLFLLLNVLVITVGVSYYLGLSRYVLPFMSCVYVALAYGGAVVVRRMLGAPRGRVEPGV